MFAINMNRELLYDRINRRVDIMIEKGLIEEVQAIYNKYKEFPTSMQALGYKEVVEFLEGKVTKEEMIEKIKMESRRYAKRQLTWFRKNKQTIWLNGQAKTQDNISIILEKLKWPCERKDIKNETGATADEEIYEIQQEYDGREILTIKPDVQYKTVLTGILKNGQPSIQEIEQLDLTKFHSGVWISDVSRNKFLQILNKCGIKNFEIDDEGYLYKKEDSSNVYSKKLDNLINSDELTVIDITGTCYIRDEMTGEVVEYPFKNMDLYQICERFDTEGSSIIIITTNDVEEIDILEAILN